LLTKAEVTANIHTHFCLIFIALRHFLLSYLFDICLLSTVIDFFFFFYLGELELFEEPLTRSI
jgi:hypothetical protein